MDNQQPAESLVVNIDGCLRNHVFLITCAAQHAEEKKRGFDKCMSATKRFDPRADFYKLLFHTLYHFKTAEQYYFLNKY